MEAFSDFNSLNMYNSKCSPTRPFQDTVDNDRSNLIMSGSHPRLSDGKKYSAPEIEAAVSLISLGNSNSSQPARILSELEQTTVSGILVRPRENASQKLNQNASQGLNQNTSVASIVSSPRRQSISSASSLAPPSLSKENAQEVEVDQWERWPGKEEPIEAWKPFLKRMGLERGKY
jgi:hypothetical protein